MLALVVYSVLFISVLNTTVAAYLLYHFVSKSA